MLAASVPRLSKGSSENADLLHFAGREVIPLFASEGGVPGKGGSMAMRNASGLACGDVATAPAKQRLCGLTVLSVVRTFGADWGVD
ncbi:hypothetical protein CO731_04886 [Aminobacter sp. MSH1]|uniref:hypothetical protein n=1 Tax=Aminobacter sp. MSH1 TaxID=374606 RepID=UPI000D5054BC|nr:hypothetical protein [Aminobacter sp. MSH1]AWC25391.1 hypothetical protein CO731_04886 [Aminobacter sp. MSH1]